jgi:probable HAF family extracellular repeat protein
MGRKLSFAAATVALLAIGTVEPATAVSLYSITELPFVPSDINDKGQIVGFQYLWDNGMLAEIGFLPGSNSTQANSINNLGQVVGSSGLLGSSSTNRAFIWQDGIMSSLGTPPASICTFCHYTTANDINDQGQVIGDLIVPSAYPNQLGFVWANGSLTDAIAADSTTSAIAINDAGNVLINGADLGRNWSAIWDNGNLTQLNRLPELGGRFSSAKDINNADQVIGSLTLLSGVRGGIYTMLWTGDTVTELGNLFSFSANSINDSTLVVGASRSNNSTSYASLWEDGELFDLNTLIPADSGWELLSASKINNKNQIVGTGKINGESRGFLLTPEAKSVPEPTSALGVLILGGFSMSFQLLRKQKHGN